MNLSINPLTGKPIDNRRRLVFDEQRIAYVSLAKGKERSKGKEIKRCSIF